MKLAILTPLFPPDISIVAQYAKLLTKQLKHMTPYVILYGLRPEKVEGATMHPISKRWGK